MEGRYEHARRDLAPALELSGVRIGVRVEDLAPGDASSVHHFHSLEEEHALVLEVTATLLLGDEDVPLTRGDHVCFPGGKEVPHHIDTTGLEPAGECVQVGGETRKLVHGLIITDVDDVALDHAIPRAICTI